MLTSCRQLTWTLKIFSIFFSFEENLYRFMRKIRWTLVIFRCLSVSHYIASRARLVASFPAVFKPETWKLTKIWWSLWLCVSGLPFSSKASSVHTWASFTSGKWNESQKNISQGEERKRLFFCNYLRRFPFEWRWDSNNSQDVRDARRNEKEVKCFIFHKAWKTIWLIIQFVMQQCQ